MEFNRSEDIFGTRIPNRNDIVQAERRERATYDESTHDESTQVTFALSAVPYGDDPRTAFGQFCFVQPQLLDLTHFECRDVDR